MTKKERQELINKAVEYWRKDWNAFCRDVLGVRLDKEQQAIVESVQNNKMTAVASGTARGKDFVAACCALCFLYLTPRFENGVMVENTKVAMTAPTDRQVKNIMTPEIRRLIRSAKIRFPFSCPGRLVGNDIRTDYEEWFLTGFKADDDNTEAWSGLHASNIMFVVTEATGISQTIYDAIEGNLQNNSRLLLVFNPNVTIGYAANAMRSTRFNKFRLDSLNAENVVKKKVVIKGQVDYEWVKDKVETWCEKIEPSDYDEGQGDFKWEGGVYRPDDLFRVKVRGMFPRVSEDVLIPYEWVELANERWKVLHAQNFKPRKSARLGVDVAGMGRDSSVLCPRYGNYIPEFKVHQSGGKADHMLVAGMVRVYLYNSKARAFIDTIGEGAGVYSRLIELGCDNAISCKFSESAANLHDLTGQYEFANMRAYLHWKMREWLNPKNNFQPAVPPDDQFMEEVTSTKWKFQSNGKIIIESKDDIKEKIKRSPDKMDAVANTFYPYSTNERELQQIANDAL